MKINFTKKPDQNSRSHRAKYQANIFMSTLTADIPLYFQFQYERRREDLPQASLGRQSATHKFPHFIMILSLKCSRVISHSDKTVTVYLK